jgi:nucleotide-binding universal stress UspA family protein
MRLAHARASARFCERIWVLEPIVARRGLAHPLHMSEIQTTTIIAGVDGSEHSADALALAKTIASPLGLEVTPVLVHPFGEFESALDDGTGGAAIRELADSVHAQMRELGTPIEDRRLTLVADRSTARGLQRIAEERQAFAITVGASRRSPLGRALLGGTAERLMAGAPSAVAIAPAGYATAAASVETIGSAFDGSPESRAALDWAGVLASRSEARVRIISVHAPLGSSYSAFDTVPMAVENEVVRDFMGRQLDSAADDLRRAGAEVDTSLLTGNPAGVLEDQSRQVDLMVSGSRGYGPTRARVLGSVSGALARRGATPLIVVPRGAKTPAIGETDSVRVREAA